MGAGQIGGIATLLDIDFDNAAGFGGTKAEVTEAQYIVYYFSHAMMFCTGALLEAHVILTPANCVYGERHKFPVFAGSHKFLESAGVYRDVTQFCVHKGYNYSRRWTECSTDNLALLILNEHFSFNKREPGADYPINRVRYGLSSLDQDYRNKDTSCRYYGWGSRRNAYLIPLLIELRRVDVKIMAPDKCASMWNYNDKFLCIQQHACKSDKFGALCPDDFGSVIVCSGFVQGMMISKLVDRPCGVGFLDLEKYSKFLTCGVDESRDVIDHELFMSLEMKSVVHSFPTVVTPPPRRNRTEPTISKSKKTSTTPNNNS